MIIAVEDSVVLVTGEIAVAIGGIGGGNNTLVVNNIALGTIVDNLAAVILGGGDGEGGGVEHMVATFWKEPPVAAAFLRAISSTSGITS